MVTVIDGTFYDTNVSLVMMIFIGINGKMLSQRMTLFLGSMIGSSMP